MLYRHFTALAVICCKLLHSSQGFDFRGGSDPLADALRHKMEKFDRLCYALHLNHLELLLHSRFHQSRNDLSLRHRVLACEMALEEVIDIADPAIPETVFLLLVPSVENGAQQVVRLLSLNHIVQNLIAVYPHEISKGKVRSPTDDSMLVLESGLKETLFLLVLLLSVVD